MDILWRDLNPPLIWEILWRTGLGLMMLTASTLFIEGLYQITKERLQIERQDTTIDCFQTNPCFILTKETDFSR